MGYPYPDSCLCAFWGPTYGTRPPAREAVSEAAPSPALPAPVTRTSGPWASSFFGIFQGYTEALWRSAEVFFV